MDEYWSWLLTAVGVTGLYFAGRRLWIGWAIGLGAQVLWLAYAINTRQWGFIVSCLAYGAVNFKNLRSWRNERNCLGGDSVLSSETGKPSEVLSDSPARP